MLTSKSKSKYAYFLICETRSNKVVEVISIFIVLNIPFRAPETEKNDLGKKKKNAIIFTKQI